MPSEPATQAALAAEGPPAQRIPSRQCRLNRTILRSSKTTAAFVFLRPTICDLRPASESRRRLQLLGYRVEETSIQSGIERHPQLAMVIVGQGDEAERLQTRALKLARRVQHFGHAADGTGSGVESDFDEVSGGKLVLQLQQSAVDGNGL